MPEEKSIFGKIIDREIPADILYEDEAAVAFKDIQPQAPIHVLVVPKRRFNRIAEVPESDSQILGHLLIVVQKMARQLGLEQNGYRIVINNGKDGGESVPHLHLHLLGGRAMAWPPG